MRKASGREALRALLPGSPPRQPDARSGVFSDVGAGEFLCFVGVLTKSMAAARPIPSARAHQCQLGSQTLEVLGLDWLPLPDGFNAALRRLRGKSDPDHRLAALVALAQTRLDFLQSTMLGRELARLETELNDELHSHLAQVRLTILSSSTAEHLIPSIRIAGLRRGLLVQCAIGGYGMVRQEILDPSSRSLEDSDFVLIAFDARALLPHVNPGDHEAARAAGEAAAKELVALWRAARERSGGCVIQQLVLDREPSLFGNFDPATGTAPSAMIRSLNAALVAAAARERVPVLDLEAMASRFGARRLFDATRWHQAKQEIAPLHAPLYGDHLARILMAARGLSRKCLVLDLDNTLWGGVIGDDGLEGIRLGQGSPEGEALCCFPGLCEAAGGAGHRARGELQERHGDRA